MTVIAFDGHTLCSDRKVSTDDIKFRVKKIYRLADKSLIGFTGSVWAIPEILNWFETGAKPEAWPQCQQTNDDESGVHFMRITPKGKILLYDSSPYPVEVLEKFWAIGTGAPYALSAMHMKRSAIGAVELANKLCPTCGDGYDYLDINE